VSNFEIIRGEVAIIRKGAGGLSYVSNGTSRGTLVVGASWPEARGIKTSESREVKTAAFDILKRIIVEKSYENGRRRSKQTEGQFTFSSAVRLVFISILASVSLTLVLSDRRRGVTISLIIQNTSRN
jgi:hypothetical protein